MKRWSPVARSASAALLLALAFSAWAVQPATWVQTTEADFGSGKLDSTVTSSLGEVSLARQIQFLAGSTSAPEVVSCVALAGKTVYAGAGNEGIVYKVEGGKAVKFAELPSTMVACLAWTGGELLVGTGGEKAGLYLVDGGGKPRPLWIDEKVKYVWAVLRNADGSVFAATGPEGKVFAVNKEGKAQVVYHADKLAKNILCLAADGRGKLYAGTDEKGLVVEIDPKAKAGRVLYDAPEKEIAALVVADDGSVFAATSDASKASADGAKAPSTAKAGKADNGKKPATQPKSDPGKPAPKPAETKPAEKAPDKQPDKKPPAPAEPEKKPADKPADKPKDKPEDKPKDKPEDKPKDKPEDKPKDQPEDKPKEPPAAKEKSQADPAPAAEAGGPARGAMPAARMLPGAPRTRSSRPPSAQPASPPPGTMVVIRRPSGPPQPTPPSGGAPPAGGPGNAVYRIRPDGLVETVFRRPVTILAMIQQDGRLVLGTGNGGGIYTATPDGDEIAQVADTDAKQVTTVLAGEGGQVLFATANKGSVGLLAKGLARKGTFVAKALDAKQIAKWGTMQLDGSAPAETSVTVATRSGNVEEPDDKTWSTWSKEMPLEDGFLSIGTPAGRFFQYRLTLTSNGKASPVVGGVTVVYQVGNLPPSVAGVMLQPSPKGKNPNETAGGALAWRHIQIQAADENGDQLRFHLQFRQVGTEPWITLIERLAAPQHIWDTRSMPDGVFELRVTASDDPANPPASALESARISDPFAIDNTPPKVSDLAVKLAGTTAAVTGLAEDATSRVAAIFYSVDSQDDWVAVLPGDGICDSGREKFSLEAKDLKPGVHRIAVRAADIMGNVGYGSIIVTVPEGK